MKKIVLFLFFFGMLSSCEEVVEVDLNTAEPRLVIEANINRLEDGTANSTVKLTTTAPFFDNQIPVVPDASVTITDDNGNTFPFIYAGDGIYQSNLVPEFDVNYTIEIIYEGESYTATQQLQSVPPLEFVEQRNDGGFSGEDIELKVYFTDPVGEGDYYFFEGLSEKGNDLDTFFDEFFDGNQIFGFFLIEDLEAGDEVIFNLYGVDEQFYNFMFVLLQQSTDQSSGPFQTQPATVRGNIINQTAIDNFPLGYFRVSEISTIVYIVE